MSMSGTITSVSVSLIKNPMQRGTVRISPSHPTLYCPSLMTLFTTLKEKLLKKLMWGSVISAIGIGFLSYALYMDFVGGMPTEDLGRSFFCGGITMLIGLAILLVFFISKRMLAKELEAEANKK